MRASWRRQPCRNDITRRGDIRSRALTAALFTAAIVAAPTITAPAPAPTSITVSTVAAAAPTPASVPWVGTNPYGFAMGDSVLQQCGEQFGMGDRSLGFVGWPGADTAMMRERLDSNAEGWPWTTESSHAEELTWFRDAGWLVIALGTNDVKTLSPEQFAANIDWFMERSRDRPVLWFTIHNPPYQAQADALNAELDAATERWPSLRLLPWHTWAAQNPGALHPDQVHVATYETGCQLGRNRLIQHGAPAVDNASAQPIGYWYEDPAKTGPVKINGWAAARLPTADSPVWVNVRADYKHVGRWPVTSPTADLWAQAAGGLGFGLQLSSTYRGRLISVDLVDANDQWTSLGSRRV